MDQTLAVSIRRAESKDASVVIDLIIGLAEFEKLPPPDAEAQKRLVQHGFGERPRFEVWLAETGNQAIGCAILFETYSTFLARPSLYLEDLFVLPAFRGRGVGSKLLRHCIQLAHERGCGRMEWTVLDWNTKAQAAYDALGARRLSEWYLYRLDQDGIGKAVLGAG